MQEDLNSSPELLNICFAILNYVCSQPKQNLRHITFGALSRAAKLESTQDVIPVSRYLMGERVPLFSPKFEFIEDLFWVLSLYANYDNQPVSLKASGSDYGIVSSVAYKF